MLGEDTLRPVFEKHDVKIVVADLSTNDQQIWKNLFDSVGERGLPVNLVYPPDPDEPFLKLPKLLSVANVTEAVREANQTAE